MGPSVKGTCKQIFVTNIFKQDSTSNGNKKLFGRFEIDEHFNLAEHIITFMQTLFTVVLALNLVIITPWSKTKRTWFKFDDSRVAKCSGDALNLLEPLETPYILFYKREDIGRSRSSDDVVLKVFPAAKKANAPLESTKSPWSAN